MKSFSEVPWMERATESIRILSLALVVRYTNTLQIRYPSYLTLRMQPFVEVRAAALTRFGFF